MLQPTILVTGCLNYIVAYLMIGYRLQGVLEAANVLQVTDYGHAFSCRDVTGYQMTR